MRWSLGLSDVGLRSLDQVRMIYSPNLGYFTPAVGYPILMRVFNCAQFHMQIFNALACDHATRIAYLNS